MAFGFTHPVVQAEVDESEQLVKDIIRAHGVEEVESVVSLRIKETAMEKEQLLRDLGVERKVAEGDFDHLGIGLVVHEQTAHWVFILAKAPSMSCGPGTHQPFKPDLPAKRSYGGGLYGEGGGGDSWISQIPRFEFE